MSAPLKKIAIGVFSLPFTVAAALLAALLTAASAQADLTSLSCTAATCPVTTCSYLDRAFTTYVLQNDVSCPGTGFAIIANDVTLDLNGHTVTYDDAAPPVIANPSFEMVDSGGAPVGWDLSGAANASLITGTFVKPVQVFSGSKSIRFSVPAADQSVTSTGTVTLEPNTTYTVGVMTYDNLTGSCGSADGPAAVKKFIEVVGTSYRAEFTLPTCRPMQYISVKFKTPSGGSAQAYQIRFGIANAGSVAAHPVYFDEVKVQRFGPAGVALGIQNWNPNLVPELTRWGGGLRATVKNGSIIQGQGNSERGNGFTLEENRHQYTLQNLTVEVHGPRSVALFANGFADNITVTNNTFRSAVRIIASRDNLEGYIFRGDGQNGVISGNQFIGSIQGGLLATGRSASTPKSVFGNYFEVNSFFTNGFALSASYGDFHDNTVNCVGDGVCDDGSPTCAADGDVECSDILSLSCRGCRGIYGGSGAKVHDNDVRVQEHVRNQEYNGCQLNGAYGVQVEAAVGVEAYDNSILAIADDCPASAFRVNPNGSPGSASGNLVHGNTLEARSTDGTNLAYVFRMSSILNARTTLQVDDNTAISNSRWLVGDNVEALDLRRNCFIDTGMPSTLKVFSADNWKGSTDSSLSLREILFTDPCFAVSADKTRFVDARVATGSTNSIDVPSSFRVAWTLTMLVKDPGGAPQAGASVTVKDSTSAVVFSGTTGSDGKVSAVLRQLRTQNDTRTDDGAYSVAVSYSSATAAMTGILMDETKEVVLTLIPPTPTPTPTPTATPTRTPTPTPTPTNTPVPVHSVTVHTNSAGGTPLSGVQMKIFDTSVTPQQEIGWAVTNGSGQAVFQVTGIKPYLVRPAIATWQSSPASYSDVSDHNADVTFVVMPPYTVTVHAVTSGGTPVQGVEYKAFNTSTTPNTQIGWALTNASGVAVFTIPAGINYSVRVTVLPSSPQSYSDFSDHNADYTYVVTPPTPTPTPTP